MHNSSTALSVCVSCLYSIIYYLLDHVVPAQNAHVSGGHCCVKYTKARGLEANKGANLMHDQDLILGIKKHNITDHWELNDFPQNVSLSYYAIPGQWNMLTAQEERKDSMTSPLPRKGSKAKQIATTQPTTKNNPKQLLLGWYYYQLKINTTPPPPLHRDWLRSGQFWTT